MYAPGLSEPNASEPSAAVCFVMLTSSGPPVRRNVQVPVGACPPSVLVTVTEPRRTFVMVQTTASPESSSRPPIDVPVPDLYVSSFLTHATSLS